MDSSGRWARVLVVLGLVIVALGTLDPLEGSVAILAGLCILAIEARLSASRHRRASYSALVLTAAGVAALFGLSSLGGVGGRTGRSYWWLLVVLPYPLGWFTGLVAGIRRAREAFGGHAVSPGA